MYITKSEIVEMIDHIYDCLTGKSVASNDKTIAISIDVASLLINDWPSSIFYYYDMCYHHDGEDEAIEGLRKLYEDTEYQASPDAAHWLVAQIKRFGLVESVKTLLA